MKWVIAGIRKEDYVCRLADAELLGAPVTLRAIAAMSKKTPLERAETVLACRRAHFSKCPLGCELGCRRVLKSDNTELWCWRLTEYCKEIRFRSYKFLWRNDAKTEYLASLLKSWLNWKDSDTGKIETENEWLNVHHYFDGHSLVNSRSWWAEEACTAVWGCRRLLGNRRTPLVNKAVDFFFNETLLVCQMMLATDLWFPLTF